MSAFEPLRSRPRPHSLAGILWFAYSGCSAPSIAPPEAHVEAYAAELGHASSPLLGGTFFDTATIEEAGETLLGCSDDDRAMFRQIMLLGRTVALGSAVRDCVRLVMIEGDGSFGPYHPCSSDPYARDSARQQAEAALRMMTTPHAVQITCTTGNIGVTRVAGQYDLPLSLREPFDIPNPPLDQLFDAEWLSNTAYAAAGTHEEADFRARVALIAPRSALVWHEAMHVHAYRHDCPNQTYPQSVPYMLQYCLQQVAQRSADFCDMRGGCSVGGERALIDSFPINHETQCECVRDAIGDERAEISATPKLDQSEPGDAFGAALAAGDFNGDGFEDLAVGAPGEDDGAGRVFLYFGSAFGLYAHSMLDQRELDVAEAGDGFGTALVAFDLDRDQITDLVVGAPGEDENRGAVYLFRGTRNGLEPDDALGGAFAKETKTSSRFGEALAADRFIDGVVPVLAVGAPGSLRGNQRGRVLLFAAESVTGSLAFLSEVAADAAEGHAGDRFGAALGFGPLTDSARPALVIGAPGAATTGAVYVLPGIQASTVSRDRKLAPAFALRPDSSEAESFGHAIALGRLAGPGTVATSAPFAHSPSRDRAGKLYLYRASSTGAELVQVVAGESDGGSLGLGLLSTGRRLLRDELLLLGASKHDPLLRAHGTFDTQQLEYRASLSAGPDSRGATALARGDFDGNGTLDLAVGIPDEKPEKRAHPGGAVEVWRRDDEGQFSRWGRYRQGD